jgi:large-conductance mechanosensitive channel
MEQEQINERSTKTNNFKTEIKNFFNFLTRNNVIQTGVALLVMSRVNRLFNVIISEGFDPIVTSVPIFNSSSLPFFRVDVLGASIGIGPIIVAVLNFLFSMYLVYTIIRLLPLTDNTSKALKEK